MIASTIVSGACAGLRGFLVDRRAVAGLAAAFVSVMFLGAGALLVDHVWLTGQRDQLKNAADAGAVAATLALWDDATLTDAQLEAIALRYTKGNLLQNLPQTARKTAENTLQLTVGVHRAQKLVGVEAKADLGGALLSRNLLGYAGPANGMQARAGVETGGATIEVVFAIDATGSMSNPISRSSQDQRSRLVIVMAAAQSMVDILSANGNAVVAFGLVPWHYRVRLDATTVTQWEKNKWAVYPTERDYPHPDKYPSGAVLPAVRQTLPARNTIPQACRTWLGCVDQRAVTTTATEKCVVSRSGWIEAQRLFSH